MPNEYIVYLAPTDREQFASYEESLCRELQDYLAEHARREGYVLLSPPEVLFETDDDLAMGEFGIATRMVQGAARSRRAGACAAVEPGATMIYRPSTPLATEAVSRRGARPRTRDRQPRRSTASGTRSTSVAT